MLLRTVRVCQREAESRSETASHVHHHLRIEHSGPASGERNILRGSSRTFSVLADECVVEVRILLPSMPRTESMHHIGLELAIQGIFQDEYDNRSLTDRPQEVALCILVYDADNPS